MIINEPKLINCLTHRLEILFNEASFVVILIILIIDSVILVGIVVSLNLVCTLRCRLIVRSLMLSYIFLGYLSIVFFELTLIQVFVTLASFINKWAIIHAVITGPTLSLMTNHSFIIAFLQFALRFSCIRAGYL